MSNKGVGVDIGTMNLVAAREEAGNVSIRRMRDAFLDLPPQAKRVLKLTQASYVDMGDQILLLGDQALELAAMFQREARRPLSGGLVSPGEVNGIDVLGFMLKSILGEPKRPGEACYYSIPAAPVDDPSKDTVYHKRVFHKILESLGYTPTASNEAMAIVFSEAAQDGFSALSFSFGSGMTNVALAYTAVEALSFSVAKGGDWVDRRAGASVSKTASQICTVKEAGIDLMSPKSREEEAVSFYYSELIETSIRVVREQFLSRGLDKTVSRPIPIIVSGGTSMAGNFLELFKKQWGQMKMPLQVSSIRHASDPFNAVAKGLLVQASQEE